jgi:iron complex outermembrane receptor protein
MQQNLTGPQAKSIMHGVFSPAIIALILTAGFTPPALGQTLEEIVVTAQRREQSRQDVPVSLTAIDGQSLLRSGIQDATDLPLYVPGLIITQIGASQITLRGISTQAQDIGGDPGVASYRDDIYLARPGMGFQEFYDVARVEVLRGPQGTLFGRNTTGGVIHAISRAPGDELNGYVTGQLGNFSKTRIEAAANVPVSDNFGLRVAGFYGKRDGYLTNLFDGRDVQDLDVYGLRLGAKWEASESFTALLTV